jgi:hypothetical protein
MAETGFLCAWRGINDLHAPIRPLRLSLDLDRRIEQASTELILEPRARTNGPARCKYLVDEHSVDYDPRVTILGHILRNS